MPKPVGENITVNDLLHIDFCNHCSTMFIAKNQTFLHECDDCRDKRKFEYDLENVLK